ncbi:MAG TPA: PIN domain-containing protein [Acidimicrobiales bacterium]|nr:PIN domain-containing protein [Acidimicrobiales bacterium]
MALIHLDSGVLIGFLDGHDAHHPTARRSIAEALDRGDRLAMAASAWAECLVAPARLGDDAVVVVHDLRRRLPIDIVSVDVDIATAAARVRARHRSLRLPDALVIATAEVAGADDLVTTDRRWPTASALRLSATLRTL